MTVNAARRPRRRSVKPASEPVQTAPVGSFAIGEINQTVFDCPTCSRPLALGTRRCPGCRTRLVLGVPMSKAMIFATAGLASSSRRRRSPQPCPPRCRRRPRSPPRRLGP
jgi:hypothetical protein